MPRDTFFCTSPLCSTSTDFPCCPNNPLASRFFLCCQLPTACTTSTWKRHVQCARWIGRQNSTKTNYLLLVSISPHLSCTPKWKSKLMILMPQKMQTSSFPCIIYQECSNGMMRQPLLCTFPFPFLHLEQYFLCKWKQDVILCLPIAQLPTALLCSLELSNLVQALWKMGILNGLIWRTPKQPNISIWYSTRSEIEFHFASNLITILYGQLDNWTIGQVSLFSTDRKSQAFGLFNTITIQKKIKIVGGVVQSGRFSCMSSPTFREKILLLFPSGNFYLALAMSSPDI